MRDNYHYDKLIIGFGVLFALITTLSAGSELSAKNVDWFQFAIGIVIALFWVGIVGMTMYGRFRTLRDKVEARDRDIEMMQRRDDAAKMAAQNTVAAAPAKPEIPAELKELMKEVILPAAKKAQEHAYRHQMLDAIIEDTGGLPLTEDRIPAVEAAYHEHTDEYVKLRLVNDNEEIETNFSVTPIEDPVPGRSEAHEDARKRGDKSRAKAADKPLTKSQQRRINAQKGHGAITDDELREKKNAERRAKRAAKKNGEAATTTTTTTQPGQTSLV